MPATLRDVIDRGAKRTKDAQLATYVKPLGQGFHLIRLRNGVEVRASSDRTFPPGETVTVVQPQGAAYYTILPTAAPGVAGTAAQPAIIPPAADLPALTSEGGQNPFFYGVNEDAAQGGRLFLEGYDEAGTFLRTVADVQVEVVREPTGPTTLFAATPDTQVFAPIHPIGSMRFAFSAIFTIDLTIPTLLHRLVVVDFSAGTAAYVGTQSEEIEGRVLYGGAPFNRRFVADDGTSAEELLWIDTRLDGYTRRLTLWAADWQLGEITARNTHAVTAALNDLNPTGIAWGPEGAYVTFADFAAATATRVYLPYNGGTTIEQATAYGTTAQRSGYAYGVAGQPLLGGDAIKAPTGKVMAFSTSTSTAGGWLARAPAVSDAINLHVQDVEADGLAWETLVWDGANADRYISNSAANELLSTVALDSSGPAGVPNWLFFR